MMIQKEVMANTGFLPKVKVLCFAKASFINYSRDFRMQTMLRRIYFNLMLKKEHNLF